MKKLYTRQVENLKRRLGQKRVSRWTENPKGRSRKKLGIKSVTLCLIVSPWNQTSVLTINLGRRQSIWSTFNQVVKWWDARRYKGNSRVRTQWDCSHICFSLFFINCIISIFRWRSLTRTPTSLYKTPIFFFCFILQERPMIYFWCMNLKMIAVHKYLHKKQKTITRNSRNRKKQEVLNPTVPLPGRYLDRVSFGTWSLVHTLPAE